MHNFRLVACFVVVGLASATPSIASAAEDSDEKIICKREQRTGTRFPTKLCYSRADWDRLAESAKRSASESFARGGRPIDDRDRLGYTFGK